MYRTSSAELTARVEDAARRRTERAFLARRLRELDSQLDDLKDRIEDSGAEVDAEDRDVARLEAGGLRAFLMAGLGDRDERLSRERTEAAAAQARHVAMCAAHDQRTAERARVLQRLAACATADDDFAAAMAAMESYLLEYGGASAVALLALTDERAGQEIAIRRARVNALLSWLGDQARALSATLAQLRAQRAALVQRAQQAM